MAEQEDDELEGMPDDPAATPEERATETPSDRAAAARTGAGGSRARRERTAAAPRGTGTFERAGSFWRDVRAELKRVAWPTLKEVQNTTIITIIAVIFFAAYLWGVDRILAFVITQLESVANRLFG